MGLATGWRSNRARPLRPRLWMVFAGLGLSVFVLALGGLVTIRLYDDQLIRQTESELLAQGAVIAEAFRLSLHEQVDAATYGHTRTAAWPFPTGGETLRPVLPSLTASSRVFPSGGPPEASPFPAEARARLAGERVTPLLVGAARSTLAGIRVVDVQGVIVASSGEGVGELLAGRQEVQQALAGAPQSLLRRRVSDRAAAPLESLSRESGVRVTVALPVLEQERVWGAVLLSRTPMTLAKAVYADRWNLGTTGAVLLVVVFLMALAAAALVVRPVRALVAQTRAISAQSEAGFEPVRWPIVEELAELSESLASTARALRDRNHYIRSFAASVSHEFKTPLAGIVGAVELLREGGEQMSAAQRDRFLSNVQADAERLTRLVGRLLELARADAMSAVPATCEPGEVLRRATDRARREGLEVVLQADPAPLSAALPAEVLEDIVGQLLANARQHGGATKALIAARAVGEGRLQLRVEDEGRGISEPNRARVFDPFFTTARAEGGTGMGLTISRALLRAFGGELTLAPAEASRGACFVIDLQRK
jgi:signal transduction histidine kinase